MEINKQAVIIQCSDVCTFINIEYPGKILDAEKALRTLDGTEGVEKVYLNPDSRLKLRYRPNDIYCKAAYGTCYPSSSVLLNVKQKRNKKTGASKLCVKLVGIISTTYKFTTMMDYQYLTVEANGDKYKSLKGISTIETLESLDWMNNGAPLHFVPRIFSPLDIPYAYHFKEEDMKVASEESQDGSSFNAGPTARKKRSNFNQTVPYEGEVPTCPYPAAELKICTEYLKEKLEEVRELFKKRPIWTRAALTAITQLHANRLKAFLPCLAYYSISGPWRTMWIRYCYDPKQHPEAKHLQLIDYRYRPKEKTEKELKLVNYKRNYSKYLPAISKAKPKLVRSDQLEFLTKDDDEEEEISEQEREMTYKFWHGIIPPYRQLFYQICDIQLPEVQNIVNANNFKEPPCSKQHGFLPPNACNDIRACINKSIGETLKLKLSEQAAGKPGDQNSESEDNEGSDSEMEDEDQILATYR
ncbi:GTF3C5 [Bugula neritina]|uniref:GTF3C5 n=1 Tax=Bugula neritina TaxID=10212 RepID=A0A7J7IX79_BUGNE|nr:GTF3C5 [Bugula neritina]